MKLNKKNIILLISVIVMIIVVIVAVILIRTKKNNVDKKINNDEIIANLQVNFENLFNSRIPKRVEKNVYLAQEIEKEKLGQYKINIKIPMMKVETPITNGINTEIFDTFVKKIIDILTINNKILTVYNVDFFCTINDDILSIAVRGILKENKEAERLIIKTYNYDLKNDKKITLGELIERKQLNKDEIQNMIYQKIQKEIDRTEKIKEMGYSVYERAINDGMYKIGLSNEFILDSKNNLYILFPYGNENSTGELDLIIVPN